MTKQQMKKVAEHIDSYYGAKEFLEDIHTYQEACQNVDWGSFLVYYDDVRAFLKDVYDETDEQADKYTNEQVWNTYKNCIGQMTSHKKYIEELVKEPAEDEPEL